ncbi:hypothetical protein Cpin_3306 [Chitinophaga pinensis DSM 2588]|uniref:Uncharacterized protein n=1 Tax=Chitinophaga pinensis (strain ATCC 43595 / DSM 2588 / LMG 13176 / NBRC 15968 / NCIMB 11800 / UQM 2034) TaxID=485918 RepID=A0A979G4W0_CHIPD|nr:hypothetical protein Cpin_3306 [Chitinophaga pinensis DSM 2588]
METFGWYRLTGLLHKKYLGRRRVEVLPVFPEGFFLPDMQYSFCSFVFLLVTRVPLPYTCT